MPATHTPIALFGQILRDEGRSQAWLARTLGVDEAVVSRWVHGLHVPEPTRAQIAAALGRPVDELWPKAAA